MEKLYKFGWDYGRQGVVEALFIADPRAVELVCGREVYFGEILGKHSEVYGELEESDLTVIDIPQEAIEALKKAVGRTISGHNPLEAFWDRSEEDDDFSYLWDDHQPPKGKYCYATVDDDFLGVNCKECGYTKRVKGLEK